MDYSLNLLKWLARIYRATPKPLKPKFRAFMVKKFEQAVAWEKQVNRKADISWALDGALSCGRDQEEWFREAFGNLGYFMAGERPAIHLIEAILDSKLTPLPVRLKVSYQMWLIKNLYQFTHAPVWEYCLLSFLVGVWATLLITL